MRKVILTVVIWMAPLAALSAQGKPSSAAPPAEKAEPKNKSTARQGGKAYVQKQTPFGTAKYEQKAEEKKVEPPPPDMRAFENGGTIRFEKKTPFGVSSWVRKESELNETERAVLERERRTQAGKAPEKQ